MAMSAPLGPIQWKVMRMGLKKCSLAIQRMKDDLRGPVRDCADLFLDDIIIRSGTENMLEDELVKIHEKALRPVVDILDGRPVVCKPTKAS